MPGAFQADKSSVLNVFCGIYDKGAFSPQPESFAEDFLVS
jgi:hypothetical protein